MCTRATQGYKHRRAYIVTQGPLKETAGDFWRMLLEFNSKCIVMLCSLNENGEVCVIIHIILRDIPTERVPLYLTL